MCAPIIQSVTFDDPTYNAGEPIIVTVTYTACCTGPFVPTAADSGGRTWTLIFNDGLSTAQFQAVA